MKSIQRLVFFALTFGLFTSCEVYAQPPGPPVRVVYVHRKHYHRPVYYYYVRNGRAYRRLLSAPGTAPSYSQPASESGHSQPQLTQEQRQENARGWLVFFMAARMAAHHSEASDVGEAILKQLAEWGSEQGMENSLVTLFPDASADERAAIKGALISVTNLKFGAGDISLQVSKEVFMAQLERRNPNLAAGVNLAERAWGVVSDASAKADRQSSN